MSDTGTNIPPLVGDPARDASAPMRGYSYQVLCSVLAWTGLQDGEALYLEGAEDFDKVTVDGATATQVKDTAGSGNVTLRSPGVLSAIGNFWGHAERNSGRQIAFRYLTTSSVGMEQGDPLGEGVPGIDLWRRAKDISDPARQQADLSKLRQFLSAENALPQSLKDFLRTAPDKDVLDKLIRPIDWDTSAGHSLAVAQAIRDRLVEYGEKRGFGARDSESALDRLYREAWSVATREKTGSLTHAQFVRCFDDASQVMLPKNDLSKILQRIAASGESASPITAVAILGRIVSNPPPLPPRYFGRASLKAKLRSAASKEALVIQGSTGTGKTSAAAEYALESGKTWGWVDLRNKDAEETNFILNAAADYLEATASALPVVLDDLECQSDARPFEGALAKLANIQRQKAALLVITTAYTLPARLKQSLGIGVDDALHMEPFTRDEIDGFLAARGCADEAARATWAAFIEVATLGHPQLVHARVAALEATGFPRPQIEDVTATARDILDVQAEARKILAELDKPSRDLIYRLSVTFGGFTRARLLAIAGMTPPIEEPGNALDRLVGPWIETVGADYFRVSPLVRSAGEEVFGKDWTKKAHRLVARALLQDKTLNADEISKILMHSILGEDGPALARLSMGLAAADQEVWRAIADWAEWFTIVGIAPGTKMPSDSKGGLFLARFLQYRIAAAGSAKNIAAIIERFEEEFPATDNDLSSRFSRFLFLSQVLLRNESRHPLDKLIRWGGEFVLLTDGVATEIPEMDARDSDPRMLGPNGKHDTALLAGYALMRRIETANDLDTSLNLLDALDPPLARRLLWPIAFDESTAGFFLDRVWLNEWKAPTHDWPRIKKLIEAAYKLARKLDLPNLAYAAAAIVIRVADEDLNDSNDALRSSDSYDKELGHSHALTDARARVLARRGEHKAALDLWRKALPNWRREEGDVALSHSYRLAAISAAKLDLWGESADLLVRASSSATKFAQQNFRVALLIDAGFAFWKAADNEKALKYLAEGIEELDGLQAKADTDEVFGIQKRAGHTVMWVSALADGKTPPSQFKEPPPACCSSLNDIPADRPEATPIEFIIANLVEFEESGKGRTDLFRHYTKRLLSSRYSLIRFTHSMLAITHCLRTLDLDGLVESAIEQAHGLVVARKQTAGEGKPNTQSLIEENRPQLDAAHDELARSTIVFGLFALVARGLIESIPLARWRRDAIRLNAPPSVEKLLDTIEGVFLSKTIDANQLVKTSSAWTDNSVASLLVGTADDTEPWVAIQCHALWAYYFNSLPNRLVVADDVATLVSRVWTRLSERTFLLVNPRASVPAIRTALDSSATGWSKVKVILTAALEAVNLPQNHWVRSSIGNIRE